MAVKFRKFVSKGSRFNQIYVPKNMETLVEVGDEVEVSLIKKHAELHYSKGLKKVSKFKESLIKGIFSFLGNIEGISRIFIVGSFLTEKISYNDIDIVLVADKISNSLNEEIYGKLIEEFNLKFHLLAIEENRFNHLLKICPLTKSMFSKFICNRTVKIPDEKTIDKNHLKFLLMMPQDLLEITLNSRAFFDSLRRLITIERFLKNNNLYTEEINIEIKGLANNILYNKIKNNEEIEEKSIGILRKMIKSKLKIINRLIENG